MTIERFLALLDAYGAEPRRWPPQERDAARAFAATPGGAAALAEAQALDAALDFGMAAASDDLLNGRILAGWRAQARRQWAIAAMAMAAAAVMGIGIGLQSPQGRDQDAELAFAAAFEDPFALGDEGGG